MTCISDSIQFSTCCIMPSGVWPSDEIGLPIETVIRPGRLINEFLGQHSPELCAIGTTTAPVAIARRVPPLLYLPFWPTGMRVPSGNMITVSYTHLTLPTI